MSLRELTIAHWPASFATPAQLQSSIATNWSIGARQTQIETSTLKRSATSVEDEKDMTDSSILPSQRWRVQRDGSKINQPSRILPLNRMFCSSRKSCISSCCAYVRVSASVFGGKSSIRRKIQSCACLGGKIDLSRNSLALQDFLWNSGLMVVTDTERIGVRSGNTIADGCRVHWLGQFTFMLDVGHRPVVRRQMAHCQVAQWRGK